VTGSTFLQSLAAHIAYMEAKEHGVNAQLAVLFCLRNRIAAGWEDGDLGRIIQAELFKHFIDQEYITEVPDVRDPDFIQILGYIESIFDNTATDKLTSGALFWGVERPLGAKERVAQIGQFNLWR
jgi:hypothetical protein